MPHRLILILFAALFSLSAHAQLDKLNRAMGKSPVTTTQPRKPKASRPAATRPATPRRRATPVVRRSTEPRELNLPVEVVSHEENVSNPKKLADGQLTVQTYSYEEKLKCGDTEYTAALSFEYPAEGNTALARSIEKWIVGIVNKDKLSYNYEGSISDGKALVNYVGTENTDRLKQHFSFRDFDGTIKYEWKIKVAYEGLNYVTLKSRARYIFESCDSIEGFQPIQAISLRAQTFRKNDGHYLTTDSLFASERALKYFRGKLSDQMDELTGHKCYDMDTLDANVCGWDDATQTVVPLLPNGEILDTTWKFPSNNAILTDKGICFCYDVQDEAIKENDGTPEVTLTYKSVMPSLSKQTKALISDKLGKLTIDKITYELGDGQAILLDASEEKGNIEIPASVTAYNLTFTVTAVADNAFKGNTEVGLVILPQTVKSVGKSAFEGCTKLARVDLPDDITEIPDGCFYGSRLYGFKSWPSELKRIGDRAFAGTSIVRLTDLPATVTLIGTGAFADCSQLTDVALPAKVTALQPSTFEGCSMLKSLKLPAGLKSIGTSCFKDCKMIPFVSFPDGLTRLGESCFAGCTSLQIVVLPAQLTELGAQAFSGCNMLSTVTCLWMAPAELTMGNSVFEGINPKNVLYLPKGAKKYYKDDPQWGAFDKIKTLDKEVEATYTIRPLPAQLEKNPKKEENSGKTKEVLKKVGRVIGGIVGAAVLGSH